jgi:hypothetical protein
MNPTLISWLMRLYPKAWRKEYGAELTTMLQARPLTAMVCGDVVRSAIWQRLRAIHMPTWVGIGLMVVTIAAIVLNIVDPPAYLWSPGQAQNEQPTLAEHIELLQRPLRSEFYVLVLFATGVLTALRGNPRSGFAAIRASMIASLPVAVMGLLMVSGMLEFVELYPGQTPLPFDQRGIVYIVYKAPFGIPAPAPVAFLLAPLLRLPGAWLWGVIGGSLGRKFANWRRRPASA